MEEVHTTLTNRARSLRKAHENNGRTLIAFAGPPGSGKSTVAANVVQNLNQAPDHSLRKAIVLPMDGFHLTRATLERMPNKEEAIARRGAQWTYDQEGVVDFIRHLHDTRQSSDLVHRAPAFDHQVKDPVADTVEIDSEVDLIVIEGNWLLLDEEPWRQISTLVDDTWFIDVDRNLALERVARRHLQSGIESTWNSALYRAEHNDMVNGDLVRQKLITPFITVRSVEYTV